MFVSAIASAALGTATPAASQDPAQRSPRPAQGPDAATQELVRQRVRTAPASTIDASLPSLPFGEWLFASLAPLMEVPWQTPADWRVLFCDDPHFPIPEGGSDLCVEARVPVTAEKSVRIVIAAAAPTRAEGDARVRWRPIPLNLRDVYVERVDAMRIVDTLDVPSLRDIAALLAVPVDAWPSADLVATVSAQDAASAPRRVRFLIDVTNRGTRRVVRAWVRLRLQRDGGSEMLRDWFPDVAAGQSIRLEMTAEVPAGRAIAVVTVEPAPGAKVVREPPRRDPAFTIVGF